MEDVEIPMPLNTTYPHGHFTSMIHQHHHPHDHAKKQQGRGEVIRYKECLKNHAASMGGNARDGCGEFMPSGEQGSIEAFTCSACNCHRNFHRKVVEGEISSPHPLMMMINNNKRGRKVIHLGHHHDNNKSMMSPTTTTTAGALGSRSVPIIPHNMGSFWIPSDHQSDGQMLKKRFRTKFTQEQKEKMFKFAERVGWKIQKVEESVIQDLCEEIGVKRRVLKVWMHNNKHNLANKDSSSSTPKSPAHP